MNLHGIVSGAIGAVNPLVTISVQVSTGYTTDSTGHRVPLYKKAVKVKGQVQPVSSNDLRQLEYLNLQGDYKAIYINGHIDGLVRPDNKGGDIITLPDGSVYLVTMVSEDWPDWCRVIGTLQNS